ncbi:BQ5605_C007g04550 [Microbotryum silenes-dioicae]|uniref:BQ5605_C007g04550 protein n=1 Tax=Microbotryum silenes-dioicae TaxID=796604 RepID=A0A2X0M7D9_9BASI|nr:BQ5605_C007g04550 [Microbotryum silenes-dioicae]
MPNSLPGVKPVRMKNDDEPKRSKAASWDNGCDGLVVAICYAWRLDDTYSLEREVGLPADPGVRRE